MMYTERTIFLKSLLKISIKIRIHDSPITSRYGLILISFNIVTWSPCSTFPVFTFKTTTRENFHLGWHFFRFDPILQIIAKYFLLSRILSLFYLLLTNQMSSIFYNFFHCRYVSGVFNLRRNSKTWHCWMRRNMTGKAGFHLPHTTPRFIKYSSEHLRTRKAKSS